MTDGYYAEPADLTVAPPSAPNPAPQPPTKSRRTLIIVSIAALIAITVATMAIVNRSSTAAPIHVHGSMKLVDSSDTDYRSIFQNGSVCSGEHGYSDITAGAEVEITDDQGKTLALTELNAGTSPDGITGDSCVFTFDASIPANAQFYGVQVTHRGVVKMTKAEMILGPVLSLGS